MPYFIRLKIFLVPSFDLEEKEQARIDRFLTFLEDSGVGTIIEKEIRNNSAEGGRPNCNYYRLFAVILYGFAFDRYSLRDIESACRFDLRYISIMEQAQVDHSTVCRFINRVIVPNRKEIFACLCKEIRRELGLCFDVAFIDGTKFEANANKYRFVWKPTTFHRKLTESAYRIFEKNGLLADWRKEEMIRCSTLAAAVSEADGKKCGPDVMKALESMLAKALEYEEKEAIRGPGRKSYYKTDHDATAMCLKSDYYSGLGSNMHAAYNVQALVVRGFVFAYYVSQSRADYADFIPVLDSFHENYGEYPEKVCADAGYGVISNYRYLREHGIGNYVKYQSWDGNVTGRNPDCYSLLDDGRLKCIGGRLGSETAIESRHPKTAGAVFFRIDGCTGCPFAGYCRRFMKDQDGDFRIFEVVKEQQLYKQEASSNLLSPKGIEIRVNRSIQVEGVFGILKQDYGRQRLRRRGLEKVSAEMMLYFLGLNLAKLFRFFQTGNLNKFWKAPESLTPEEFRKPSARKLSKKGKKINQRMLENRERRKCEK